MPMIYPEPDGFKDKPLPEGWYGFYCGGVEYITAQTGRPMLVVHLDAFEGFPKGTEWEDFQVVEDWLSLSFENMKDGGRYARKRLAQFKRVFGIEPGDEIKTEDLEDRKVQAFVVQKQTPKGVLRTQVLEYKRYEEN